MVLLPAFGREYKTKKDCKADWDAGKDFLIYNCGQQTTYANKDSGLTGWIELRFANKTKECTFKVT